MLSGVAAKHLRFFGPLREPQNDRLWCELLCSDLSVQQCEFSEWRLWKK